jgi:hypothetical protein
MQFRVGVGVVSKISKTTRQVIWQYMYIALLQKTYTSQYLTMERDILDSLRYFDVSTISMVTAEAAGAWPEFASQRVRPTLSHANS